MYPLLAAKDVAVMLGVSERTVLRMFERGALRAMQVNGKVWRIRRSTVEAYVDEHLGTEARQPVLLRRTG